MPVTALTSRLGTRLHAKGHFSGRTTPECPVAPALPKPAVRVKQESDNPFRPKLKNFALRSKGQQSRLPGDSPEKLRLAVPKSDSFGPFFLALLKQIGFPLSQPRSRQFDLETADPSLSARLLKTWDIPALLTPDPVDENYIARHCGFTGLDCVAEATAKAQLDQAVGLPVSPLGELTCLVPFPEVGTANVHIIGRAVDTELLERAPHDKPLPVATEYYSGLGTQFFQRLGTPLRIRLSRGSTEAWVLPDQNGRRPATFAVDNVESGKTLEHNGLSPLALLMETHMGFFASQSALQDPAAGPRIRFLAEQLKQAYPKVLEDFRPAPKS